MPEKYGFIENCRCHRVVLAAHSQFLREMLKETDPDPDTARDHDNHNQTCDIYLSL